MAKLFWPDGGGAELATYLIAKNILSKCFKVTIISGTKKPMSSILKNCQYIWWHLLTEKHKPVEWLKLIENTRQFVRFIKQADVVYIPSHTLLPLAIIAKQIKPNIRVVVHLHNYQPLTYTSVVLAGRGPDMATDFIVERYNHNSLSRAVFASMGHYMNVFSKLALRYVDRVVCVSKRQCGILTEKIPALRRKAVVVYNPPPQISKVEKRLDPEPTTLYVGGDSYVKGFHILLMASKIALKKGYNIKFLLAGDFKNINRLLISKFNERLLNRRVYYLMGHLGHEEILKLHTITHALLFPSITEESFPYAVLEAMLLSTIPIASRVGGVPEIVEGSFAEKMLFEPYDVNELIDRLELLLSMSNEQIKDVGSSLREAVLKKFDSESIKKKLIEVFS
jgi:glycosyltransferase involved in cell wall biosynthesis